MMLFSLNTVEIVATIFFFVAVVHTFLIRRFQLLALRYPDGSVGENFFHLLGEVEIVFGLWAGIFLLFLVIVQNSHVAINYMETLRFREPIFVFTIMVVAATRPVLFSANYFLEKIATFFSFAPKPVAFYSTVLILGPLLGSFMTEPAAMTLSALILKKHYFDHGISQRLKYATLAVLFVNVSIGGVLTHFAAPPVVMVANIWNWDIAYMFSHFGWKAVIAVVANTFCIVSFFWKEIKNVGNSVQTVDFKRDEKKMPPLWLVALHYIAMGLIVFTAHYVAIFLGIFFFFLGVVVITEEYQEELKLRESLLVGFFLSGLVVLGGMQEWWLTPLLTQLEAHSLFLGTSLLTAVMDNAALTYLASQVPNVAESLKMAVVAGAVAGGGLTVIANAPNPVGFSILKSNFGEKGISPLRLLLFALFPTLIAMACLWFLPSL